MKKILPLGWIVWILFAAGCSSPAAGTAAAPTPAAPAVSPVPEDSQKSAFTVTSPAFSAEAAIPAEYTCDGEDRSPPLEWSEPPAGTSSFALVMDDPDARGFIHWVLYNLPAETRSLAPALPQDRELGDGSRQGVNSFTEIGYGGPCPPSGTHHYRFTLYALDSMLELPAPAEKADLDKALTGRILDQTELIGTYTRR